MFDYKEEAQKCWSEGYDAGRNSFHNGSTECPYHAEDESYSYEAWSAGWWWYCSMVH